MEQLSGESCCPCFIVKTLTYRKGGSKCQWTAWRKEAIRKDIRIAWISTDTFCSCVLSKAILEETSFAHLCRIMLKLRTSELITSSTLVLLMIAILSSDQVWLHEERMRERDDNAHSSQQWIPRANHKRMNPWTVQTTAGMLQNEMECNQNAVRWIHFFKRAQHSGKHAQCYHP